MGCADFRLEIFDHSVKFVGSIANLQISDISGEDEQVILGLAKGQPYLFRLDVKTFWDMQENTFPGYHTLVDLHLGSIRFQILMSKILRIWRYLFKCFLPAVMGAKFEQDAQNEFEASSNRKRNRKKRFLEKPFRKMWASRFAGDGTYTTIKDARRHSNDDSNDAPELHPFPKDENKGSSYLSSLRERVHVWLSDFHPGIDLFPFRLTKIDVCVDNPTIIVPLHPSGVRCIRASLESLRVYNSPG